MTKLLLPVVVAFAIIFSAVSGYIYLQGIWPGRNECRIPITPSVLENNLRQHVWALAEYIGERHYEQEGSLDQAAAYIHSAYTAAGLVTEYQQYRDGYKNLQVTVPAGKDDTVGDREVIVVGAHYDTVWLSSGADDNASGIAVLLELARLLGRLPLEKTIQFVAFTNEEQPFSETDLMGSKVYINHIETSQAEIIAMYSLEMLGYYSDEPGSQHYPFPLNYIYPDRGNFAAFVSNVPSSVLLWQSLSVFRRHSLFPVEGLIMSEKLIPDIRRSDHATFWDKGIPALMLTDTAFYRNERYHTVGDLPHTLDYTKMAQLTAGLACMLKELAGSGENN